ncbi:MAG: T9SS type A sorting domain-containing protein [Candidatus Eisenbacteria bacterium]
MDKMACPAGGRVRFVVTVTACLLGFLLVAGDSSEYLGRDVSAAAPSKSGRSQSVKSAQTSTSTIMLTVAVAAAGVTVRLYDEYANLFQQTALLTPPAVASLRTPEGATIELSVPDGVFSGSAIIDIYMKGRTEVRPKILEADRKAMDKSAIPFGDIGAVEFVATARPARTVAISLSYPAGSSPALLNSLRAYYLEKRDEMWLPVESSRLDPENRTVTFDVSSFEVFRLMAGSAHDLRSVIVYPNPFRPRSAKDNVLKFIGLTDNVEIKIFTLNGDVVWRKHIRYTGGGATWNGTNLEGREVASGLYVYQVTNGDGEKATGRISVIW